MKSHMGYRILYLDLTLAYVKDQLGRLERCDILSSLLSLYANSTGRREVLVEGRARGDGQYLTLMLHRPALR